MGSLERLGESRAERVERDMRTFDARLELLKRTINQQGRAVQYLGETVEQMAAQMHRQDGRIEELESELSYRLLPFWRRGWIQMTLLVEQGGALWRRLREAGRADRFGVEEQPDPPGWVDGEKQQDAASLPSTGESADLSADEQYRQAELAKAEDGAFGPH